MSIPSVDELKGKWKQQVGAAKIAWGKLTEDELLKLEGHQQKLAGLVQERYEQDLSSNQMPPLPAQSGQRWPCRSIHMSFAIYLVGVAIFLGGLVYGAILLNVPHQWIVVGGIILLGLSIITGVKVTRQKDPAA